MRFFSQATSPKTDAHPASASPEIDSVTRIRILVETAMEHARFSDTDSDLIVRELAGELNKTNAMLSEVRIVVQDLYQGDRAAAEAYLSYLAKSGFPPSRPPVTAQQSPKTQQQVERSRTIEDQNRAIAQHDSSAYGQLPVAAESAQAAALNRVAFYGGNLIAELVTNSAYSGIVFGERRSGTSAILRAIAYDQISKSGATVLDILDLHNGEWGGLEQVRLEDGSRIVTYCSIAHYKDIEPVSKKLSAVAREVERRQLGQNGQPLSLSQPEPLAPYLFLIDGLSELHGALPGWTADRRSKDPVLSQSASNLRFILCHGPAVNISCLGSARDHSSCLCDSTGLDETKLLFLGRISAGRNGGYRAIDKAIEDKLLLPSPYDRSRCREAIKVAKQAAYPVVFTPNGIPRLGGLGDFGGYLSEDLLTHYQHSLEVQS